MKIRLKSDHTVVREVEEIRFPQPATGNWGWKHTNKDEGTLTYYSRLTWEPIPAPVEKWRGVLGVLHGQTSQVLHVLPALPLNATSLILPDGMRFVARGDGSLIIQDSWRSILIDGMIWQQTDARLAQMDIASICVLPNPSSHIENFFLRLPDGLRFVLQEDRSFLIQERKPAV